MPDKYLSAYSKRRWAKLTKRQRRDYARRIATVRWSRADSAYRKAVGAMLKAARAAKLSVQSNCPPKAD